MSVHKRSARGKIVEAALPIADARNSIGALEYIERRLLDKSREHLEPKLAPWRRDFLDWLKLGEFTSLAKMLFRYIKLVERIRDGITPRLVVAD